ncbi:hypothetical protein LY76DRAFT_677496 [Colletotrichum caudatum]|nr:hypothetical protein LY76DRAFT_677496 [Colletotrichum caudatum]
MATEQEVTTHTFDPESPVATVQSETPAVTLAMATPPAPGPDRPKRTPLPTSRPALPAAVTDGGAILEQKPKRQKKQCRGPSPKTWPCFILGCRSISTGDYTLRRVRKRVTVLEPGRAEREDRDGGEVDAAQVEKK